MHDASAGTRESSQKEGVEDVAEHMWYAVQGEGVEIRYRYRGRVTAVANAIGKA